MEQFRPPKVLIALPGTVAKRCRAAMNGSPVGGENRAKQRSLVRIEETLYMYRRISLSASKFKRRCPDADPIVFFHPGSCSFPPAQEETVLSCSAAIQALYKRDDLLYLCLGEMEA
ncbi:MAG TPA: hypothetical protein VFX43_16540, partial [Chitinophagaceae bacterium]|nr:hypothetical protein [Chitinophagaceae bacterium]